MVFSAPEMTTVSKPNKKPARAAVSDQKKIRRFMLLLSGSRHCPKDISFQKVVAQFSLGIVSPAQFNKLRQLFVAGTERFRADGEQLAPVRTNIERCQFCFDHRQQLAHGGPILFPREMNRDARFLVTGTHPELVGCDAANLRN